MESQKKRQKEKKVESEADFKIHMPEFLSSSKSNVRTESSTSCNCNVPLATSSNRGPLQQSLNV